MPPPSYLVHFACFKCRHSFKRKAEYQGTDYVKTCPRCGGRSIDLGRHFKPPKASDLEQWEKVRRLVAGGFFFQHVRNAETSQVPYPETLNEVAAFVSRYRSQAWTARLPETLEILAEVAPRSAG